LGTSLELGPNRIYCELKVDEQQSQASDDSEKTVDITLWAPPVPMDTTAWIDQEMQRMRHNPENMGTGAGHCPENIENKVGNDMALDAWVRTQIPALPWLLVQDRRASSSTTLEILCFLCTLETGESECLRFPDPHLRSF
jgi:hypothetical protein